MHCNETQLNKLLLYLIINDHLHFIVLHLHVSTHGFRKKEDGLGFEARSLDINLNLILARS